MSAPMTYFIVLVIATLVYSDSQTFHANTRYGKRAESEMSSSESNSREGRSPDKERFFIGSRYGKRFSSSQTSNQDPDKEEGYSAHLWNTINQPSIRNDRFFIGSRYGKRNHLGKPQRFKSDVCDRSSEQDVGDLASVVRVFQNPCPALN